MFTKLHKEERELLFKTNSVVAYEVYMHLKDKYSYFKAECYDLTRCISDYLDVPERTIKDAIKRLKTVGLISTTKKGKVNIYSFPILNKIEGKETKEEMIETPQVAVTGCTSISKPIEEKNDTQPQQVEEKPIEAIKTTIEETIPNEFMEGLTDNTEEVEFDNFSETFNKWLDDGKEEKLMEMATNIVKYEYMGIGVAKTAYELAKTRFQQMLESLDGQDEKDMLCRHFDELLMLKKENYKEFIKVA